MLANLYQWADTTCTSGPGVVVDRLVVVLKVRVASCFQNIVYRCLDAVIFTLTWSPAFEASGMNAVSRSLPGQ